MRDLNEIKKKYPCTAEDIDRVAVMAKEEQMLTNTGNILRRRMLYYIKYWSEQQDSNRKLGAQAFSKSLKVDGNWFNKWALNEKTKDLSNNIKDRLKRYHPELNIEWVRTGEGYFLLPDEALDKKVDDNAKHLKEIEQKAEDLEKEVNRLLRLNSMLTERLLKYGDDFTGLSK